MWRIYVGGMLTGFGIGFFVAWLAAWTIAPESTQLLLSPFWFMFPVLFVVAGERLRIRGSKLDTRNQP